jgi:hypothetical protein
MRDIDIWGEGGEGWSTTCCNYTNNGENVNVTPILCNTGVNVRITIRLPNTMKVFMSLNTFEWIYQLQFLDK